MFKKEVSVRLVKSSKERIFHIAFVLGYAEGRQHRLHLHVRKREVITFHITALN